jgi:predicted nucleic acid-binding protein
VAGIERDLITHAVIGLDTSIFIYHFEANPSYLPVTTPLLNRIKSGQHHAIVSTVALMELTVHPWRLGKTEIAQNYESLLVHFPNLRLVDVTRRVARRAAQLRANYGLRPADALQTATALVNNASAFITNDKRLTRLNKLINIIILDDYI